MQADGDRPWFPAALAALDLRRRDRLLAIDVGFAEAKALRTIVGRDGETVLVLRDRQTAERVAGFEWDGVRVLAHTVGGDETFGSFDALLMAPAVAPVLSVAACAELARRNLRLGGRFVFDLPAREMVPDLAAAWRTLAWPEAGLAPLVGVDESELADALRAGGLRQVHAAMASHLLAGDAPAELVATFATSLGLGADEEVELSHALLRQRATAGPLQTLVHRTRIVGRR